MTFTTLFSNTLSFLLEEEAATAVEYAVMVALIVAVCIGSITFLADATGDSIDTSSAAIEAALN